MALETLAEVKEINGFAVTRGVSNFSKDRPIFIHDETNQIAFQLQNQPIDEIGLNGCQVDELIATAKMILEGLNKKFPCRENSCAITHLDEAMHWLIHRRNNRTARGVEGKSLA
jgi:hypothetical protein